MVPAPSASHHPGSLPVFTTLPWGPDLHLGGQAVRCKAAVMTREQPSPQSKAGLVAGKLVTGLPHAAEKRSGTGTRDPGRFEEGWEESASQPVGSGSPAWHAPAWRDWGQTHVALRDQSQVRPDKKPPAEKSQPWRPPGWEQGLSSAQPLSKHLSWGLFPPTCTPALFREA